MHPLWVNYILFSVGSVLQFFAKDELLISADFWNLVCKSENGYEIVLDELKKKNSYLLKSVFNPYKSAA